MTIIQYIAEYLDNSRATKAYGTYDYEKDILNTFIRYCKDHDLLYFSAFNQDEILGYLEYLNDKGLKNISRNKHTKLLKQVHKYFDLDNRALFKMKRLREDVLLPEIIVW